jgi:hypothetical protein
MDVNNARYQWRGFVLKNGSDKTSLPPVLFKKFVTFKQSKQAGYSQCGRTKA